MCVCVCVRACVKNRYEMTTKNTGEANEIKADGISALNGFGDQDPFTSNKAKEAFSAPMSDPFGSAFPVQQSNVSSLYDYVHVLYALYFPTFYDIFSCATLSLFCIRVFRVDKKKKTRLCAIT